MDLARVEAPMRPPVSWIFERVYVPLLGPLYRLAGDFVVRLPERPATVWDIGCGAGNLLDLLLGMDPRVRVVGIDPSPELMRAARRRLSRWPKRRWELRVESAEESAVLPDPGDVVVSLGSIKHWVDPVAVLKRFGASPQVPLFVTELHRGAAADAVRRFVEPLPAVLRGAIRWQLEHRVLPRALYREDLESRLVRALPDRPLAIHSHGLFLIAADAHRWTPPG